MIRARYSWVRGTVMGLAFAFLLACLGERPSVPGDRVGNSLVGASGGGGGGSNNPGGSGASGGAIAPGGLGGSEAGGAAAVLDDAGNPADPGDIELPDDGSERVIASGQAQPVGIALGGTEVYWANHGAGTIVKCPKSGCGTASPAFVTFGHPGIQGIALRGSTLYWVVRNQVNGVPSSEVMKCDVNACGSGVAAEPNPVADGAFGPYGIAVSDERVYVAGWTLLSCPVAGCGLEVPTVEAVNAGIINVAVSENQIHFMRRGGIISACTLDDCAGTEAVVLSGALLSLALARDESSLYWSQYSYEGGADTELGGVIRTCPLAGCDPASATTVVSGQIGPAGIALDDSNIYYTDHLNGRVVRAPKTSVSAACVPTQLLRCGSCGGATRCDGSCTIATPANFSRPCGECGGTILCNGQCGPVPPASFNEPCGECGGTIQCNGQCSITECPL